MTDSHQTPELPKGWAWTKLEEIATEINSGFPSGRWKRGAENGVPHLRPMNIDAKGRIDLADIKYVQAEGYDALSKGDVIFNNTNSPELLGKTAYIREETNWAYSNHMTRIRFVPSLTEPAFIGHYLHFLFLNGYFKTSCVHHVNQASIGKDFLSKMRIPFPPNSEQKRVVTKLEELFARLDAGVEGLWKVKAQLKRYCQAVLKYAFEGKLTEEWRKTHKDQMEPATKLLQQIKQEIGDSKDENHVQEQLAISAELPKLPETWIWTKIGEVETFIGSGITPRGGRRVYVDRGIPFIRSQNVHADGLRLKDIAYVTQKQHAEMERTHTKPNDVLLNITGASIGRSAYIPQELDKANVNQHVCIVRTGWWIVPSYLSHFLNSSYGQDQIFQTQSGVTRQGLNYAQVRNLRIPLAPLPEQNLIVDKIEEMLSSAHDFEKVIIRGLAQTERLRQSILKAAFDGTLVPQDPNDEPAERLLERVKADRAKSKGEKDTNRRNKAQLELSTYVK